MNCSIFWPDVVKNSDRWWFSIMTIYTVHCAVSHFTWPLPVTILRVWRGWLAVFAKSDLVWYLFYTLIQCLYKGFHTLHAVGVLTHCASSLLFCIQCLLSHLVCGTGNKNDTSLHNNICHQHQQGRNTGMFLRSCRFELHNFKYFEYVSKWRSSQKMSSTDSLSCKGVEQWGTGWKCCELHLLAHNTL